MSGPHSIHPSQYLVLDHRIIEEVVEAKLTLGEITKHPQNPLFGEDKPWEPRFDNVYANVIYDVEDELYKCWYNPFIIDERVTHTPPEKRHPDWCSYMDVKPSEREMGLCYACSSDGIHWEKPELGLVEFGGNKQNNILMRRVNGAGVFKDGREINPARRYKMFFCGEPQMTVAFSPDGLRWREPLPIPQIEAHGTHPNAFWAETLGKYVGITRQHARNIRLVTRAESPDFVHWTPDASILEGPNPRLQAHDMIVFPTCGIYIGLLGMMVYPEDSDIDVKQHVELAWSPDTIHWHRIQEGIPFMGNTPSETERYGETPYDWGTIFPSAPIFFDDEIRIYYGAGDGYFFNWRNGYLALATLRPDGWAGYEPIATDMPAVITTQPLIFDGTSIGITADVSDGGSVRVAILDNMGRQLTSSQPIYSTVTDSRVKWESSQDLANLKGKQIRLRFQLHNAKLYAFRIGAARR
ncbi:hypothetical protein F4X10_21430 [Candidatus Poribacteria bacterium]|nr:hypothetical protein [Candidatus Poribacteria bacterium]